MVPGPLSPLGAATWSSSEVSGEGDTGDSHDSPRLDKEVEGDETENLLGLFWPRELWLDGEGGLVQVAHRDDVLARP